MLEVFAEIIIDGSVYEPGLGDNGKIKVKLAEMVDKREHFRS